MQILLVLLVLLALLAYIIFQIRHKFRIRELTILITIIISFSIAIYFYLENKENKIPNLFKVKYEEEYKTAIKKFSSSRVNNLYLTSDKTFIYDFNYILEKEGIEYFCSIKNQKIIKIEDEYIFEDFDKLNEKCIKK